MASRCGGIVNRLRRAALLAFCTHLIAGLGMAFVLRVGDESGSPGPPRLPRQSSRIVDARLAHLDCCRYCDFVLLLDIRRYACGFPFRSVVDCRSPRPDLAAQSIEIGVLAGLAAAPEQFLIMHRVAVMLSGYLANGLYSATAIMLAWAARDKYPVWVSILGLAVGLFGVALSIAALLDSAAGMFWTNVLLVPTILLWLAALCVFRRAGP